MWDVLSGVAEVAWDVLIGAAKMAWDVLSGVTKTAWDVLSGVANCCGMFCPGWQKMAWDVLSRDVLSYIQPEYLRTIVFRMILICDVVLVLVYTFKPKKCITYVCMNTCLGSTPLTETPAFRIFCGQNIRGRNVRAEMSYIHTNMMMTIV